MNQETKDKPFNPGRITIQRKRASDQEKTRYFSRQKKKKQKTPIGRGSGMNGGYNLGPLLSLNVRVGSVGKGATKQQSGVVVLIGAPAARPAPLAGAGATPHLLVLQPRVELHQDEDLKSPKSFRDQSQNAICGIFNCDGAFPNTFCVFLFILSLAKFIISIARFVASGGSPHGPFSERFSKGEAMKNEMRVVTWLVRLT
jgi:hypothetical protein